MMSKPYFVAIVGPSASGKSTLVLNLKKRLKGCVTVISHDSYYRDQSDKSLEERKKTNYDDPAALETDLLIDHLEKLSQGKVVNVPVYDFKRHTRSDEVIEVEPRPIIILEGAFILWEEKLRKMMSLKIFLDVDAEVRLARRIKRDLEERGRELDFVLWQYFKFVKVGEEKFITPMKKYADILVPQGGKNEKAVEVISSYLRKMCK